MANFDSINKTRELIKTKFLTEVKPWLNDFMQRGKSDNPLKDIEFVSKTLQTLAVLLPAVQPRFDSTNHGTDTHLKMFSGVCLSSIKGIMTYMNEISKTFEIKNGVQYDQSVKTLLQTTVLVNAVQFSYHQLYDIYKTLKDNKDLCDALFDQDREFWKSL